MGFQNWLSPTKMTLRSPRMQTEWSGAYRCQWHQICEFFVPINPRSKALCIDVRDSGEKRLKWQGLDASVFHASMSLRSVKQSHRKPLVLIKMTETGVALHRVTIASRACVNHWLLITLAFRRSMVSSRRAGIALESRLQPDLSNETVPWRSIPSTNALMVPHWEVAFEQPGR